MAKKHKKRFKIKAAKLKSIQPVQPKATPIQGIKTSKVLKTQPIPSQPKPTNPQFFKPTPAPKLKLDSFEKSFLKLAKEIKMQKRQQNQLNQTKKVKPIKQKNRDIDKIPYFGLKQKTKVEPGHTFDFSIIKQISMGKVHEYLNEYGQKGIKSLLKFTVAKIANDNIKINKLLNRFNKLNKKDLLSPKEIYDFTLQIRKAIKPIKIKPKQQQNINPISGFQQRRSYEINSKISLDDDALIEMMLRALIRDYDFDFNKDGKLEFKPDFYFQELEKILQSFSEGLDLIFDENALKEGRFVLNEKSHEIYDRVRMNPDVKVKPIIVGTPKILN